MSNGEDGKKWLIGRDDSLADGDSDSRFENYAAKQNREHKQQGVGQGDPVDRSGLASYRKRENLEPPATTISIADRRLIDLLDEYAWVLNDSWSVPDDLSPRKFCPSEVPNPRWDSLICRLLRDRGFSAEVEELEGAMREYRQFARGFPYRPLQDDDENWSYFVNRVVQPAREPSAWMWRLLSDMRQVVANQSGIPNSNEFGSLGANEAHSEGSEVPPAEHEAFIEDANVDSTEVVLMQEALKTVVANGLSGVVAIAANATSAERASASMNRLLDEDANRCDWSLEKWVQELSSRKENYSKKTIQATAKIKGGGWQLCLKMREAKKKDRLVSKETGKDFSSSNRL
ncbi:hypothetical protein Q31b_40590 [Novipirellula aureliae]|uniref:Uncharacterized protein n=1 Tax=Novipirellula aureliae TaxID=2527966 RepID=A0A5C6DU53_9BACT|nr:hypothetical protein [Novipirellula aureliae]TWU38981.1 hypothetical protein Q31b_40590 [Novipirellula aureliae]